MVLTYLVSLTLQVTRTLITFTIFTVQHSLEYHSPSNNGLACLPCYAHSPNNTYTVLIYTLYSMLYILTLSPSPFTIQSYFQSPLILQRVQVKRESLVHKESREHTMVLCKMYHDSTNIACMVFTYKPLCFLMYMYIEEDNWGGRLGTRLLWTLLWAQRRN